MTVMVQKAQYSGRVEKLYTRLAWLYDSFTRFEAPHHVEAIRLAQIRPEDSVLEVACGTGSATVHLAGTIGESNVMHAVDITEAMMDRARRKLAAQGLVDKVRFAHADARRLPFPDGRFDVLYNAYMFDLIDAEDMPQILKEFHRVLKPDGRLVLVNMSKNKDGKTLYEALYERGLLWFASGGCRPVALDGLLRENGFGQIERLYRRNRSLFPLSRLYGTEIIVASRLTDTR